jgi:hypothetical protein
MQTPEVKYDTEHKNITCSHVQQQLPILVKVYLDNKVKLSLC